MIERKAKDFCAVCRRRVGALTSVSYPGLVIYLCKEHYDRMRKHIKYVEILPRLLRSLAHFIDKYSPPYGHVEVEDDTSTRTS